MDVNGPGQVVRWDDQFVEAERARQEVERTRARYDARIEPLLASQARNPGVKLPAIARLEAERNAKVKALMNAHWKADALDRAKREQPKYLASARERQLEGAALTAFANDLGRGHRSASQPPSAGRETHDVFIF